MTLAFEKLSPLQLCARFSRGVGRPVKYVHGPIEIAVSIPSGYREHLEILEQTLGDRRAPYFGPSLEYPNEARSIWEGYRGIEEYAREVFPLEESTNGLRWMDEGTDTPSEALSEIDADSHSMESSLDLGHATLMPQTPAASRISTHIVSGAYTPRSHPEALEDDFFVGSC